MLYKGKRAHNFCEILTPAKRYRPVYEVFPVNSGKMATKTTKSDPTVSRAKHRRIPAQARGLCMC
jgi:hypothetical protein